MRAENLPELAIQTFRHYYGQLLRGETGIIHESEITPVIDLPDAEAFGEELATVGRAQIPRAVSIKLNGGLGTSMGLEKAKSLLEIKKKLTFLDIIAKQTLTANIPLVFMNSFATQDDTLAKLQKYPELFSRIPIDFLQNKIPKIRQQDLRPATSPESPHLEWCPPGHGDLYTALVTSGTLEQLLRHEYRYCFVSNSDNLGAIIDERILGHFVSAKCPFLMEVADRTEADRKGGHLARLSNGKRQLILREAAQCSQTDSDSFQDINLYAYFNTNNLWIDLWALRDLLEQNDNVLTLPMIRNSKTLDPTDQASTPVYQLETAMGAAIGVFPGADAVRVPRTRFAPVKTCSDLLTVRSDLTILTPSYLVKPNPARTLGAFQAHLDTQYYGRISQLEERFPFGPPSLIKCRSLKIIGDFAFGEAVCLKGDVKLVNNSNRQANIPEGAEIDGLLEV
jgi:UTP--glucose-1-phosphate uridylyltransferase